MKKLLLAVAAAISFAANAQIPQALSDKLNYTYDSLCTKYHIKGSSAAILIPNQGIWKRTYGISAAGKPIAETMVFSLGSNTKTYTSAVILKLHEKGMLRLTDTIGKWFSGVANVRGDITVKQLLNHTSGIASYTDNSSLWTAVNADLTRKWTPNEILPYIATPLFAPGASWSYSNSNFLLAGIIIKNVTGKSLSQAYHEYIFTPCGLGKTFLATEETSALEFAHRWTLSLGSPSLSDWDAASLSYDAMNSVSWAAGGLYATAEDNVLFFDALFNGKKIVSDSMLVKMKTTVPVSSSVGYGLALFSQAGYNGRTVYAHGGTNLGAINENVYDPISGYCMSILTNQDSVGNTQLQANILLPLHKELLTLHAGLADNAPLMPHVSVYPNPSTGPVRFEVGTSNDETQVVVHDATGKIVSHTSMSGSGTIDLEQPGFYFYRVIVGSETVRRGTVLISR